MTHNAGNAYACERVTLPNWRLRRVVKYVDEQLDETISLADMAAVAGLSPMHFAAQVKLATGMRPHHYLIARRIQALRPQGFGKTRSWRVYVALKLNLPRRGKRRLPERIREPLEIPMHANHTWSADFMSDALWSGRRFRTVNVNDDINRQSLRIEIDTSLPSQRVIRVLDELVELRGAPRRLRLDNGPEFISAALKLWAKRHGVELLHIQPGKPTQNAYIERFNRTSRTEVLDRYVFTTLTEVRRMTEDWQHRYNHDRPHRSLGGLSPNRYAMASSNTSTSG